MLLGVFNTGDQSAKLLSNSVDPSFGFINSGFRMGHLVLKRVNLRSVDDDLSLLLLSLSSSLLFHVVNPVIKLLELNIDLGV